MTVASTTARVRSACDASRAAHGYTATGETTASLSSSFEGTQAGVPVTKPVAAATGPVIFTVQLDQGNSGARLMRLSDQQSGYQRAAVFVDGVQVGTWLQPLANATSCWLEDSFELPASATAGKTSVTVRLAPVAGAPAWSAARYRVESFG